MRREWRPILNRWLAEGLVSAEQADRIRAFEERFDQSKKMDWPVLLALILGGIALGAGLLLLVAANWDRISPSSRFALALFLTAVFHLAGAMIARDSRPFQIVLHAVGTVALGGAIALTGQIFQLPVDWPAGTLLWALGALGAWLLLRDSAQLGGVAILVPLWLCSVFAEKLPREHSLIPFVLLLLAIVYFGSADSANSSNARLVLIWIGGIAILPLGLICGFWKPSFSAPEFLLASVLALAVAFALRGVEVWIPALFVIWLLAWTVWWDHNINSVWTAVGSVGLVAWGWRDRRRERINLGVAGFAMSVLAFYVSSVLDKLGRSLGLITLGALLLGGAWLLERGRRSLVRAL